MHVSMCVHGVTERGKAQAAPKPIEMRFRDN